MMPSLSPKHTFLIDACGAVVSATMLGLILPRFEYMIGMPSSVLRLLSIIACLFAVYSFFCYKRTPQNWMLFLRGIALANFCYCMLTLALIVGLYDELTALGLAYFVAELIILFLLITFECKRYFTKPD